MGKDEHQPLLYLIVYILGRYFLVLFLIPEIARQASKSRSRKKKVWRYSGSIIKRLNKQQFGTLGVQSDGVAS